MIWIRADANSEIGTGHVMRCLSVAMALREQGSEVCFLLADDKAVPLLESRGQAYLILHTSYNQMEQELPILKELAEQQKPDVCLIDSYYVTEEYLTRMGELCKTVYMDDKFDFAYPVDMVINYNIYGDMLPYKENPGKPDTDFLLGVRYAPLRKEFRRQKNTVVRREVREVLITTGGSDKYNLAGQILQAVLAEPETEDLRYHVVSGVFNKHYPALKEMAENNPHICIHQNVTNMIELMQKCDVAITAGGSTMYELCAVGVPIICFSFVDNQEKIVETFADKKLVCYGGNYQKETLFAENVVKSLCYLVKNRDARAEYSRLEQQLVDGRGAERIARTLQQMEGYGDEKQ